MQPDSFNKRKNYG